MTDKTPRIVIIGAGPTGLGAAVRCLDLGHTNFTVIDSAPVGGLSRSYVDDKGFLWDIGGHVIFSHYSYFDDVMDFSTNEWLSHQRESWVWCQDVWVPYPFQNNIHRLPPAARAECLDGLLDVFKEKFEGHPQNFREYFTRQFGPGIAKYFMAPYNFKVWAVPPETMSTEWMGERVATVDVRRVCKNVCMQTDDLGWGPNAQFRFPVHGGTGGIWSRLAARVQANLPDGGKAQFMTGSDDFRVLRVDAGAKEVHLRDGTKVAYDTLISTMAIDDLLRITTGPFDTAAWPEIANGFQFSTTHVIGLGIRGSPPKHLKTMCWMYFPEPTSPFYRATVFSNYSPTHAPEGCWSLMLEVSESAKYKPVDKATVVAECIRGCIASDLLTEKDEIVSKWTWSVVKGYPTPFVGRNELLARVMPTLEVHGILSRGRFGAWKYEVANQDHSLQQGVEAVERALGFVDESDKGRVEATYNAPNVVNGPKNTGRRMNLALRKKGATVPANE